MNITAFSLLSPTLIFNLGIGVRRFQNMSGIALDEISSNLQYFFMKKLFRFFFGPEHQDFRDFQF